MSTNKNGDGKPNMPAIGKSRLEQDVISIEIGHDVPIKQSYVQARQPAQLSGAIGKDQVNCK
jgi:hypothetical protein